MSISIRPGPSGLRRRGVRHRHLATADHGPGGRDRGGHGPLRRPGVPRPAADRRPAARVQPQFRRAGGHARRPDGQARGPPPRRPAGTRRHLQPHRAQRAARARRPQPDVRAGQPAVALGRIVPRGRRRLYAAARPRHSGQGRQHRIRRHARRLRCARRCDQGRGRGPGHRALDRVLARADRLYRLRRRQRGPAAPGAAPAGDHASGDRAEVAVSVVAYRRHRRLAGAGGARLHPRPDGARDAAAIRLCARVAGERPGDVGQPHRHAPRAPLRRPAGSARPAPHLDQGHRADGRADAWRRRRSSGHDDQHPPDPRRCSPARCPASTSRSRWRATRSRRSRRAWTATPCWCSTTSA